MLGKNFFYIIVIAFMVLDYYSFQAVRSLTKNKWVLIFYVLINLAAFIAIIYLAVTSERSPKYVYQIQWLLGLALVFYFPKLFIAFFMIIEDIFRLFKGIMYYFSGNSEFMPSRRKALIYIGLGMAGIALLSVLQGIFIGRFSFRIKKNILRFKDLPSAFDGFKIVQISDVHIGSFTQNQKDELLKGTALINKENPDLVLFTGDLVNFVAEEAYPFEDIFKSINPGKYGKFSVLGNHDYGEYAYGRKDVENNRKNVEKLKAFEEKVGFTMLRNQSLKIKKGEQFINLVGVENWGKPPFPQYGDLELAMKEVGPDEFSILMSHDPSHFEYKVLKFKKFIHLTLSGHTHGAQFGIDLSQYIKWSPAQYIYKRWAGLYEEMGKYLYVNQGFGFIGMPARIGIFPEITVIELRKDS